MTQEEFDKKVITRTITSGNRLSVNTTVEISENSFFSQHTVEQYHNDLLAFESRRQRERIAMLMYGDITDMLFALQRSMQKSPLGEDSDSLFMLRSIMLAIPK